METIDPLPSANDDALARALRARLEGMYVLGSELLLAEAHAGDPRAMMYLGEAYYSGGWGLLKDQDEAFFWYKTASEKGYIPGVARLAGCLHFGTGVGIDRDAAAKLAKRLTSSSNGYARGFCPFWGIGMPTSHDVAFPWFLKSAQEGDEESQNMAGICYDSGKGVPKDKGKALEWFSRAANLGNASGQLNYGEMLLDGEGCDADEERGLAWIKKSADQQFSGAVSFLKRRDEQEKEKTESSSDVMGDWNPLNDEIRHLLMRESRFDPVISLGNSKFDKMQRHLHVAQSMARPENSIGFCVRAVNLLKYDGFPRFQGCPDVEPFNPYNCNLFISHRWISVDVCDDGRYFNYSMQLILRFINRLSQKKFLREYRVGFPAEWGFDRCQSFDFLRHCVAPSEVEMARLNKFLDVRRLSVQQRRDIFAFLNDIYVWFDYTCVPQAPRSADEEHVFQMFLKNINLVLENSFTFCIWGEGEYSRGWCLAELYIAQRIRSLAMYRAETYDLRQNQIDEVDFNHNGSLMASVKREAEFMASCAQQPPLNLTSLDLLPESVKLLLQNLTESQSTVKIHKVLEDAGVKCTNGSDLMAVSGIVSRYNTRYDGFKMYQPVFTERVPADFRTQIFAQLAALYSGGMKMFDPVLWRYVHMPVSSIDEDAYAKVVSDAFKPFHSTWTGGYYPTNIKEQNVLLLIVKFFSVQDFYGSGAGWWCNNNLEPAPYSKNIYTADGSAVEGNTFAVRRTFPVVRSDYDFSLAVLHETRTIELLMDATVSFNGEPDADLALRNTAVGRSLLAGGGGGGGDDIDDDDVVLTGHIWKEGSSNGRWKRVFAAITRVDEGEYGFSYTTDATRLSELFHLDERRTELVEFSEPPDNLTFGIHAIVGGFLKKQDGRIYRFRAETAEEKEVWVSALRARFSSPAKSR